MVQRNKSEMLTTQFLARYASGFNLDISRNLFNFANMWISNHNFGHITQFCSRSRICKSVKFESRNFICSRCPQLEGTGPGPAAGGYGASAGGAGGYQPAPSSNGETHQVIAVDNNMVNR